jgi:hypothetical protein
MVGSDCSSYIRAALFHGFNRSSGRTMLKDDAKFRKASVQVLEGGEECLFSVEDGDAPGRDSPWRCVVCVCCGHHGEKFADGALHYNDPVELVLQESLELWPNNDRILISIGTGSAPGQAIDTNLKALVSQLVSIATETEETARSFLRVHEDMARANRLFRFNVYHGLGEIGLDESKEIPQIASRTRTYLRDPDITRKAIECVAALKETEANEDNPSKGI